MPAVVPGSPPGTGRCTQDEGRVPHSERPSQEVPSGIWTEGTSLLPGPGRSGLWRALAHGYSPCWNLMGFQSPRVEYPSPFLREMPLPGGPRWEGPTFLNPMEFH